MITVNQGLNLIILVTVLAAYIVWNVIIDEFDYIIYSHFTNSIQL